MIDYDHMSGMHSPDGPKEVMSILLPSISPGSILDVGCGKGTWLKAANELGITDVCGIDGVLIPPDQLLFTAKKFQHVDLTTTWSLGRQFDLALCLEVAEHLDEKFASQLIYSLAQHAGTILFSAACPYQPGQHHVNCQWPSYWQHLFNQHGYSCEDTIRPLLWDNSLIEPWYRQNMFIAKRKPEMAGKEDRLHAYVHPDMLPYMFYDPNGKPRLEFITRTTQGHESVFFYLLLPFQAFFYKISRFLKRRYRN